MTDINKQNCPVKIILKYIPSLLRVECKGMTVAG